MRQLTNREFDDVRVVVRSAGCLGYLPATTAASKMNDETGIWLFGAVTSVCFLLASAFVDPGLSVRRVVLRVVGSTLFCSIGPSCSGLNPP